MESLDKIVFNAQELSVINCSCRILQPQAIDGKSHVYRYLDITQPPQRLGGGVRSTNRLHWKERARVIYTIRSAREPLPYPCLGFYLLDESTCM